MTDLQIHLLTSEHDKHFGSFSLMLWDYIKELHTMDQVHVTLRTQSQLVQEYFHGISCSNCYVLLDNDTCIGFAILGTKPNCHPAADIYIEELYIDNTYRKQRYGTAFAHMLLNGKYDAICYKNRYVKNTDIDVPSKVCFYELPANTKALSFWKKVFHNWKNCSNDIRDIYPLDWLCWNFYERQTK